MPLKRAFAGIASATAAAVAGQTTITGLVPAGSTATAYKNGSAAGAATVSALGVASYTFSAALAGGDKVYFAWSLTGQTPLFTVPGMAKTVTGILGSGDSITRGYGLPAPTTDNWLAQLAALAGLPFYNDGVDGKKLQAIDADWATSGNAGRYSAASLNTYVQMGGCNDLRAGALATDLQTYIQSVIGKAKSAGYTAWVCTILPETGYAGWGSSAETQRTNYNTWLRNNYASFADGLIDWATASQMQDTSSTVYYQDSLHPAKAGAAVLAQFAQTAMALPSASSTRALGGAVSGVSKLTGALTSTVAAGALAGAIGAGPALTGALTVTAAASGATVQWNASDKNAAVTRTSATRVDRASTAGGTWASIRSDTSKSSGVRYVEFTVNVSSSDGLILGFANATEALTNYMGQSGNSTGVWSSGTTMIGPTFNTNFGTWAAGDVICLLLDFGAKTFSVKRNASAWATPQNVASLVGTGALFVGATMKSNAELPAVTANFGDQAFVYTPPTGAVAWNA
ncbi:GDSL-type esterase/lipase family protein [Methylobacterium sp. D53M]